jgi:hypothetical protein
MADLSAMPVVGEGGCAGGEKNSCAQAWRGALPATLARQPWLQAGFSDGWPLVDAAEIFPLGWRRLLLSLGGSTRTRACRYRFSSLRLLCLLSFATDKGGLRYVLYVYAVFVAALASRTKLTSCNSSLSASSAA